MRGKGSSLPFFRPEKLKARETTAQEILCVRSRKSYFNEILPGGPSSVRIPLYKERVYGYTIQENRKHDANPISTGARAHSEYAYMPGLEQGIHGIHMHTYRYTLPYHVQQYLERDPKIPDNETFRYTFFSPNTNICFRLSGRNSYCRSSCCTSTVIIIRIQIISCVKNKSFIDQNHQYVGKHTDRRESLNFWHASDRKEKEEKEVQGQ